MANDSASLDWLSLIDPPRLIVGTPNNDVLSAQAEGDIVSGLAGDDHLNSTFNLTALIGGIGEDALNTEVVVPLQSDAPVHGIAIQLGETGNDSLNAMVTLQAGDGFPWGTGTADVLVDGGNGNDGINAVAASGAANAAALRTFVIGGGGNDNINVLAADVGGSGETGIASNQVLAGSGNDFINASTIGRSSGQKTVSNELHGGSGDDLLHAFNQTISNSGPLVDINRLWGDEGNDILKSFQVATGNTISDVTSYLDGGKGGDQLLASINAFNTNSLHALIQLEGGEGNDILAADLATGPSDSSSLEHFDGGNVLNGGSGDDQLNAFLSATLNPLAAPDLYASSTAENHLDGGAGNDVLTATVASDSIGSSFLKGGAGNDQLTVFGGSANILDGGDGEDTLTSGMGNDSMVGGKGADTFVIDRQNGHDTADFEQGRDIIDLTALAFTLGPPGQGGAIINDFADLNIQTDGVNTVIHFDTEYSLTVLGVNDLGAGDFLFG